MVLVALVVIIIIAAVASSPFGLYFAAERNAPDTVSVAEAVAQVNIAYNAKLEELQAGDYDSIDIQGQTPDWSEVLAVFAAKTAGTDDGVDVASLDADRVAPPAVFWDMTKITSWVETINHPEVETMMVGRSTFCILPSRRKQRMKCGRSMHLRSTRMKPWTSC